MGIIFANLAIFGTSPIVYELFIIIDDGNERAYFKSFTNLEDTPSWPLLAFDLKLLLIAPTLNPNHNPPNCVVEKSGYSFP